MDEQGGGSLHTAAMTDPAKMPADARDLPAPSGAHWPCEVCRKWVLPLRPHRGWRIAEIALWIAIPGAIGLASKGPGLVALPIVFMVGAGLVGPMHAKATAEARCPGCDRYIKAPPKKR